MAAPIVRFPGALWLPISRNYGGLRSSTRGVVLHVAASEAKSLRGWFNNPDARASSHLYVRRDGTIEQYVSMDHTAWTSGSGSASTVGVETQGMGSGEWTGAQVTALVRIVQWCQDRYGFPLRAMTSSKAGQEGVGWHALGVPRRRGDKTSQTGGQLWSSSAGKVCPGAQRIRQIPEIVTRAGGKAATPAPAPTPTPAPKRKAPTMYVTKYGRNAWRLITGDYIIAIPEADYNAFVRAGIPHETLTNATIVLLEAHLKYGA